MNNEEVNALKGMTRFILTEFSAATVALIGAEFFPMEMYLFIITALALAIYGILRYWAE